MTTKTCSRCKETLDAAAFHSDSNRKDGLQSYCKTCQVNYVRDWQENNRERVRGYYTPRPVKVKVFEYVHSGKNCTDCGHEVVDRRSSLCGLCKSKQEFLAKWPKQCACGRRMRRKNQIRCVDCKVEHDRVRRREARLSSSICKEVSTDTPAPVKPTASTLDPLNATS